MKTKKSLLLKILRKKIFQAFTLVELIVVIVILAILGTLAFIAMEGYSKSARNSTRLADLDVIKKSLELHIIKTGIYPLPTDGTETTYSGAEVWTQGVVGKSVVDVVDGLRDTKELVDPLTSLPYTYSRLNTGKEYEIAAVMEGEIAMNNDINLVNKTYAADQLATAYVKGTYNGVLAKVNISGTTYTLAVPTIISGDLTLTDILELQSGDRMVYHGKNNLPDNYKNSQFKVDGGGFEFNPSTIVAYTGTMESLKEPDNQVILLRNLQDIYSGTDVVNLDSDIKKITEITIDENAPSDNVKELASFVVKNSINPGVAAYEGTSLTIGCNGIDFSKAFNNYRGFFSKPHGSNMGAFIALKSDGSITAWGSSGHGGTGAPTDNGYTDIYSSNYAFAALKSDGSITAWGISSYGGDGEPTDNGYTKIFSTEYAFAALKSDGSITAWGDINYGGNGEPTDNGYTKIFSTLDAFAALKSNGTITAWGATLSGGDGEPTDNGYYDIVSNQSAFAALKSDGSITAWGISSYGGDGEPTGSGYTNIVGTRYAFAALKSDGSITTWGNSGYGGDGGPTGTGYTDIFSTGRAFAALKSDGSITAWGDSLYGGTGEPTDGGYIKIYSNWHSFAAIKVDGSITTWGNSGYGGSGGPTDNGYTNITSTGRAFAALRSDGVIMAWGSTYDGGTGEPIDSGYTKIISNGSTFAAMKSNGSIITWGSSIYGGTGTPTDSGYVSINGVCNN